LLFESAVRNIGQEGFTHDEVKKICQQAEDLMGYIHLSDGCYEALKYTFPDEDGIMLKYAEKSNMVSVEGQVIHQR
jgi:hypothetical protein